jgi:hypothetical protein
VKASKKKYAQSNAKSAGQPMLNPLNGRLEVLMSQLDSSTSAEIANTWSMTMAGSQFHILKKAFKLKPKDMDQEFTPSSPPTVENIDEEINKFKALFAAVAVLVIIALFLSILQYMTKRKSRRVGTSYG